MAQNRYFDPLSGNRLIEDVIKEFPRMTEIMERYFGQNCFKKPGFKIQTLGIACILFGVDRRQLLQEFKKVQNCGGRTETESLDHFG